MKLLIDDADITKIRKLYDLYPIDGVTTNPTILSRTGRNPKEVLDEIRSVIGDDLLFVQAIPEDAQGMVEDAEAIVEAFGKNTVVKIPCDPQGFKAMKILKEKGITTCGTAVYTPMQAYLGAKAGASYVAPYVNRIDNMGYDGVEITKQIHEILVNNDMDCMVLAASFKNSQQVKELCAYGIGSATAAPDVIEGFVRNAAIDQAVADFRKDFYTIDGEKSMKDFLR
ncbi:MAG: transaldolase family protein [Bulleidia sp.]